MEEIIEIFADAISAFILKSITLQEENAEPQPVLRNNAAVVDKTAQTLVQITRKMAAEEYKNYPGIQAPMLECVSLVEKAVSSLMPTIDALFADKDRTRGWRSLVDCTKVIGEQTSRLLVVVYGAENKRLELAAQAALRELKKQKEYTYKTGKELRTMFKPLSDQCTEATSKVAQFNTYLGGKYQGEKDADRKEMLLQAFNQLNKQNEQIVNATNSLMKDPDSEPAHKGLAQQILITEDIIHRVMGTVRRPEELDAFKIIENLFNATRNAIMTTAKEQALAPGETVSIESLEEAGRKVIEACEKVKKHRTYKIEDCTNNTSIASKRIAHFNELCYKLALENSRPALTPKLKSYWDIFNKENKEIVNATNDYLNKKTGNISKSIMGSDDKPTAAPLNDEIRTASTSLASLAKQLIQRVQADPNSFVVCAQETSVGLKELLASVNKMLALLGEDPHASVLLGAFNTTKTAIVGIISAGKTYKADPTASSQAMQKSGVGLKAGLTELLKASAASVDKLSSSSKPVAAASDDDFKEESKRINACADRIIKYVLDILGELKPSFDSVFSHRGAHAAMSKASRPPLTDLEEAARQVEIAIREYKNFPNYTPKETVDSLDNSVVKIENFLGLLAARGHHEDRDALKREIESYVSQIAKAQDKLISDTQRHVGQPNKSTESASMGSADNVVRLVREIMEKLRPQPIDINAFPPSAVSSASVGDIETQAKKVLADLDQVDKFKSLMPIQLKSAGEQTLEDTNNLVNLLDWMGSQVKSPDHVNDLRKAKASIDDAKRRLVDAVNENLRDPSSTTDKNLEGASKQLREEVKRLLKDLLPQLDMTKRYNPSNQNAKVTPKMIQAKAQDMQNALMPIENVDELSPKEIVLATEPAKLGIAGLADAVKARSKLATQPEMKAYLEKAFNDLDKMQDRMLEAEAGYLRDPLSSTKAANVKDAVKALNSKADEIVSTLLPTARVADDSGHKISEQITPKMVEEMGNRVKKQVTNLEESVPRSMPKQVVADAEKTSAEVQEFTNLLRNMEEQQTRPGIKQKLKDASSKLREANEAMINKINKYLRDPDDSARLEDVRNETADIKKLIDQIIKDVKPKAKMASAAASSSGFTDIPKDLRALGEKVKIACRTVKDGKKSMDGDGLVKATNSASQITAEFTALVDSRGKKGEVTELRKKLSDYVPRLTTGNKELVDAANKYVAEPKPTQAAAVDSTCDNVIRMVDEILGMVHPRAGLQTLSAAELAAVNARAATRDELEVSLNECREAVKKVKQFREIMPKELVTRSEDASKKLAKFAAQLRSNADKTSNKKFAEVLRKKADLLEGGNKDLIATSNNYLDNPDDYNNADDLEGTCDRILDILDDIEREILPKVSLVTVAPEGSFDKNRAGPKSIEEAANRTRKAVTKVEDFRNMTPKNHAEAANDFSKEAAIFADMIDAYGDNVSNAAIKSMLKDCSSKVRAGNRNLVAASTDVVADLDNTTKHKKLDDSCASMKKIIDEVMAQIRPHAEVGKVDSVGAVTPGSVVNTAIDVQKKMPPFKDLDSMTPAAAVKASDAASHKIAQLQAEVSQLAKQATNPQYKNTLEDISNQLKRANNDLVASINEFVDDPSSAENVRTTKAAAENLERLAAQVIEQVLPKANMPPRGAIPTDVNLKMLAEAHKEAKIAVDKAKKAVDASPLQLVTAAEEAAGRVGHFQALGENRLKKLKDPSEAKKLLGQLALQNQKVIDATNAYIANPNASNKSQLQEGQDLLNKQLDAILTTMKPKAHYSKTVVPDRKHVSEAEIEAKGKEVKKWVAKVANFMHEDEEQVCQDTSSLSKVLAEFTGLATVKSKEKEMIESCRVAIKNAVKQLDPANKAVVTSVNTYIADPTAYETQNMVRDKNRAVGLLVDKIVNEIKAAADKKKSFEDLIEEAADEINMFALNYDMSDEIVGLARELAEAMAALADAARRCDRQAIIQLARKIADLVKKINSYSDDVKAKCSDSGMRNNISIGTSALGNFSVQLKIIASVKAATIGTGSDPTAESQLVACAQGISSGMKQTLSSTQSAKLKQ